MKVRYTSAALDDLASIASYLQPRNPAALVRVRDDIRAAARTIGQHPYSGRQQDIPGVRKSVTRLYAYLIFYVADEAAGAVTILSVQHPSQDREHTDA